MLYSCAPRVLLSHRLCSSVRSVAMCREEQGARDIPRPRSLPVVGTKLSLIAAGGGSRLHEYIHKRHSKLGPIFCENMNGTDIVFTSDPEFMRTLFIKLEGKYPAHLLPEPWVLYNKMYGTKRGIFFMDGEEWLHYRKILNKLILREGSENWLEGPIKHVTDSFINRWITNSESKPFTPQLEPEFYRLSIDVIISILIGTCETPKTKHYEYLLVSFAESVQKIFQTTTKLYVLPASFYANYNLRAWRNFKESVDTSLALARKLVREILLLENGTENGLIQKLIQNGVTEEDIVRIVADFVIAAGDTTSYTLLWTLYLLSTNKATAMELKEKNPKFINHIIKESMRLYPVAPFLTRIIPKECTMGPFVLNGGTPIVASIYTSGRSELYFSAPEQFLPQRWDRDNNPRTTLPLHVPSASLPFALGSRSCIGKKIAQLQLANIISKVMEHFDLTLLNKKRVKAVTSQVLVPKDPIKIQLTLK